jgi:hypothetical protein
MLLLRDVHHVMPWGECRTALVTGDGAEIDTVDLAVDRDMLDVLLDPDPDALCTTTVRGVRYDATGKPGTWHTASDCPHARR